MTEPKTVGILMGLGQGWAGQSPRHGSSFCSSIPAPGRECPVGIPRQWWKVPSLMQGGSAALLGLWGGATTPNFPKPLFLGLSELMPLPRPPRQSAGSWLPPPSLGSLPTRSCTALACYTLWRREEKREKPQPRCH